MSKIITSSEFKLYIKILLDFTLNILLTAGIFIVNFLGFLLIKWFLIQFSMNEENTWQNFSDITTLMSIIVSLIVMFMLSVRTIFRYSKLLK